MEVVVKYLENLKDLTKADKLCFFSVFVLAAFFLGLMAFPSDIYLGLFLIFCLFLGFCLSMILGSNITTEKVFFLPVKAVGVVILVYAVMVWIHMSYEVPSTFSYAGYTDLFIFSYVGFWSFFAIVLGKKMYDVLNYLWKYISESVMYKERG